VHLLWIMNEMCGGLCTTIGARFEGWLWFVTPFCGDLAARRGLRSAPALSEALRALGASLAGNLGVGRLWVRAIFRRPVGFAENVVPQGAADDPDSSFDSL
jgi:hypothetical protein